MDDRLEALEKQIESLKKVNRVLMARVERAVDDSGDAFALFERNIMLQQCVEERTRELEERRKCQDALIAQLTASQTFLTETGDMCRVGGWSIDLATMQMQWTAQTRRIFMISDEQYAPSLEEGLRVYPAGSRATLESHLQTCIKTGRPFRLELEAVTSTGKAIWVRVMGRAETVDGHTIRLVGAVQDMSDEMAVRMMLDNQRTRLSHIIESTDVGTWEWNAQTGQLEVNERYATMLGYSLCDLVPITIDTWNRLIHPDDQARFNEAMGRHLRNPSSIYELEVRLRHRDGHWVWVNDRGRVATFTPDGQPEWVYGTHTDISARKNAELAMAERERRFRTLFELSPMGLALNDPETGAFLEVNRALQEKLGYTETELYDRTFSQITAPEFAHVDEDKTRSLKQFGKYGPVEKEYICRDGTRLPVRLNGIQYVDDSGRTTVWSMIEDLTAEREAQELVHNAAAELEQYFENSLDLLCIIDTKGCMSRVNSQWTVLLGYDEDELVGRPVCELVHIEDLDETSHMITSLIKGQKIDLFTNRLKGKDGHEHWLEWRGVWCEDRIFAVARDITQRKMIEDELIIARDAAQAATRSKSEFLANMSHEIRTPMTGILGYTDILAEGIDRPIDPTQYREAIEVIKRNGAHLMDIINDILDLSKIESGKMTVEQVPVDLRRLVGEVEAMMLGRARSKGLTLNVDVQTILPTSIQTDPLRLRQILVNLVGNAIKFTEQGSITIEMSLDISSADCANLVLTIRDTGIGLDCEQMSRLFHAFEQADTGTTRRFGGTGLGLRISRSFANLMGGDITVQSKPGEGSAFALILPAGTQARTASHRAEKARPTINPTRVVSSSEPNRPNEAKPLAGARILLVEDGIDNQRLISFHLRRAGASVTCADNGLIALQTMGWEAYPEPDSPPPPFDLIVSDMQMPEMDGYTLAGELRCRGWKNGILALTAHAMSGDAERCLTAGCDAYATKPIDAKRLIHICRRLLDDPASMAA